MTFQEAGIMFPSLNTLHMNIQIYALYLMYLELSIHCTVEHKHIYFFV